MRDRETKERQTYEQTTDETNRQAERERECVCRVGEERMRKDDRLGRIDHKINLDYMNLLFRLDEITVDGIRLD